jgi:hypothetical protein
LNSEASPFDKIQTLIDKIAEDKLASNNEINSLTLPDPEILSFLETPSSGEADLGGNMY